MNEDKDNDTLPMTSPVSSEGRHTATPLSTVIVDSPPSNEQAAFKQNQSPLIDDRFAIERELGRGGFGVTYLAFDLQDNRRRVVIKALLEQPDSKTREWVERHFREEVKALSRIDHPGVVKLVGSGEMPDGRPYLAMEFVEGYELRSQIEPERGAGDFDRIARIIRELGEAITAAHEKGVYHRDLKPENILLHRRQSADGEEEEHVKVIDFGISTVKETLDEKTRITVLAGSVRYIAPEQIEGRPSATTDIYAMGVIAYEMITGRIPFNPDLQHPTAAMLKLLEMQRAGVSVKPKDLRSSLPIRAQETILRALSYDPAERYQRAEQFGNELARALTETALDSQKHDVIPTRLEMAYVLFTDIVGYSKLPMDLQRSYLHQFQEVVRNTAAFRQAHAADQLISLPTGDGMALAFFGDPMAAVHCAVEISRGLKQYPHIKLRMGVNTGPVYHVADINANRNVAGGGINIAQRVMDCGDAGHILVSQNMADVLLQLSDWQEHLHDLGVHQVKHGVQVHLYNLYTSEVGNLDVPDKLRPKDLALEQKAEKAVPPVAEPYAPKPPKISRQKTLGAAAALVGIGILVVFGWRYMAGGQKVEPAGNSNQTTRTANGERGHTISYWGELQSYRNNQPVGKSIKLTGGIAGETYFRQGDGIRFFVESSDDGHFYLLNEEAGADGSGSKYNILFPSPEGSNLSSGVIANRQIATSECIFDANAAAEKIWIVWSAEPIGELEDSIRKWANEGDAGEIKSASTSEFVRQLLEQRGGKTLQVEQDKANERIAINGVGNILVYLLKLRHVER